MEIRRYCRRGHASLRLDVFEGHFFFLCSHVGSRKGHGSLAGHWKYEPQKNKLTVELPEEADMQYAAYIALSV